MKRDEIITILISILKSDCDYSGELSENTALLGEKCLDSMAFMTYIVLLEDKFKLAISEEDINKYRLGVIGNMATYLAGRVN
jgi:acyl carrier protein